MRKEWPLWERFYTELKQTVFNSWYWRHYVPQHR